MKISSLVIVMLFFGCSEAWNTQNRCRYGREGFNSPTHIYTPCCGSTPYNWYTQICCDGALRSRDGDNDCCGSVSYNKYTEICCGETIFERSLDDSISCCDGSLYDLNDFICCNGMIYPRGDNTSCCGSTPYTVETHTCCRGRLTERDSSMTCSGQSSKRASNFFHLLFNYCIWGGRVTSCCGDERYDFTTHVCCNGSVSLQSSGGTRCCGDEPYDLSTYICCNGNLSPRDNNTSCCNDTPYNKYSEICCDGEVSERGDSTSTCSSSRICFNIRGYKLCYRDGKK